MASDIIDPKNPVGKIRDQDLLEQLEKFEQGFGRDVMRRELTRTQAKRDAEATRLAAMTPAQRKREEARILLETDAISPDNLRHIHSVLAICSLPYTRQPDHVREYEQRQGRMSLVVTAGKLLSPDGVWEEQPLPHGSRARLLLLHLCSEAIRQKSATINIEDSLTAFIHAMGYPVTGGKNGTINSFKQQINALAACTMRIGVWDGKRSRTVNTQPFAELDIWFPNEPDQRVLWPSTITFSRDFYATLSTHALPVNIHTVRHFAGSPRKLDILFWLGYRLNSIRKPLNVSWAALKEQFGQGFSLERQFKAKMIKDIAHIHEVFPKLPLSYDEHGITLQPADSSVLAIPKRKLKRS
jgi:hypothetical protein